jgi:hypothetical protein
MKVKNFHLLAGFSSETEAWGRIILPEGDLNLISKDKVASLLLKITR